MAQALAAKTMQRAGFHRLGSDFAERRIAEARERLARGETLYLAGIGAPGTHNSGVALVEVTQARGPVLIVNNEEERFSGNKHTTEYPKLSIDAGMSRTDFSRLVAVTVTVSSCVPSGSARFGVSSFAGLCSLRDLDLDLFGMRKILCRDAEARARNLLDLVVQKRRRAIDGRVDLGAIEVELGHL